MVLEISRIGLDPDYVDYQEAWSLQRRLHDEVAAGQRSSTVLLLEHAAVYTAGKRTEPHERPFDGTPVIEVDRGGKLTWHGPGQLVGYPILALLRPAGIKEYVSVLEEIIIRTLRGFGVEGVRIAGRSGVWVEADSRGPARKVAAIGIRVNHGVTMHGFAINCNHDLAPYSQIVACGIADAGVTTIAAETGKDVSPTDIADRVEEELQALAAPLVQDRGLSAAAGAPDRGAQTEAGTVRPEGALL